MSGRGWKGPLGDGAALPVGVGIVRGSQERNSTGREANRRGNALSARGQPSHGWRGLVKGGGDTMSTCGGASLAGQTQQGRSHVTGEEVAPSKMFV